MTRWAGLCAWVRAIEHNNWSSIDRCVQAYPHLNSFYSDAKTGRIDGTRMRNLREHAVLLHRADLLDEMRSIQEDSGEDDEHTQANRRSRVAAKLKLSSQDTARRWLCCRTT